MISRIRTVVLVATLALASLLSSGPVEAQETPVNISPPEVHRLAAEKKVLLVDIRRPDEWAETGVGEYAVTIDMEDPLFTTKLNAAMGNDRTRPVALICRSANRTRIVQQALTQHGYTKVINVEGGMSGNAADKGWIAHGLPVAKTRP